MLNLDLPVVSVLPQVHPRLVAQTFCLCIFSLGSYAFRFSVKGYLDFLQQSLTFPGFVIAGLLLFVCSGLGWFLFGWLVGCTLPKSLEARIMVEV